MLLLFVVVVVLHGNANNNSVSNPNIEVGKYFEFSFNKMNIGKDQSFNIVEGQANI